MAPNSVKALDVAGKNSISQATKNANSIAELISTLPQTYRSVLGARLTDVYRIATKLCTVQNTLVQYQRHLADGSYPASIANSLRESKLQFSKEFLGTEDGKIATGLLNTVIHNARRSFLETAEARKKEEQAHLQSLVSFDQQDWRKKILEISVRVATTFGGEAKLLEQKEGSTVGWSNGVPLAIREECQALWEHGSVFHYRAIALARSIADRSLVDKAKNLSIKRDTDTVMKDIDTEPITRELVRDEMQAQIRLLESRLVRTMNPGKKSAPRNGGKNPSRVTKGPSQPRKGKGKGKGRK